MKFRQGFVSNSSSSSFIIGAGKIKNYDNFKKWMKKNKITPETCSDILITATSDILNNQNWEYSLRDNRLVVEGSVNHSPEVSTPINPAEEDLYCVVTLGNSEGDDAFWDGEEMNYDIDSDYFKGTQAAILEMLQSGELLDNCSCDFGAGRHG